MISKILHEIYDKMFAHFGPQHWWPGETPFEVMVGAVLTQNTNWGNVEKAITNLKKEKLLSPIALEKISPSHLAPLIKPAGYFNIKTKRLKNFIHFLMTEYEGSVKKMCAEELFVLREKLLAVNGIGPETADSILLYAAQKPIFVIDQYTYRVLTRHFLISEESDYHEMQEFMMRHLSFSPLLAKEGEGRERPRTRGGGLVQFYNEYHAQIVMIGKHYCKKKPLCEKCPLKGVNW